MNRNDPLAPRLDRLFDHLAPDPKEPRRSLWYWGWGLIVSGLIILAVLVLLA
jgi:hypothetical protein